LSAAVILVVVASLATAVVVVEVGLVATVNKVVVEISEKATATTNIEATELVEVMESPEATATRTTTAGAVMIPVEDVVVMVNPAEDVAVVAMVLLMMETVVVKAPTEQAVVAMDSVGGMTTKAASAAMMNGKFLLI
jgi:hypothetical protein